MPEVERIVVGRCDANCYIVYDRQSREAAVIDPGDEFERIKHRIDSLRLRVENILITHGHFDHMLAAAQLRKDTGARVSIGKRDAERLSSPQLSLCLGMGLDTFRSCPPDVEMEDFGQIKLLGMEAQFIPAPGHTPGSCLIRMDNAIFTGDVIFEGTCGRTDFPGGDTARMMRSLAMMGSMIDDYILYPGHGEVTTLGMEKDFNPYLIEAMKKYGKDWQDSNNE